MKTVKMPTLDRNAKTINVTREFLIRAGQFGSPEFNILLDMQKTNPGFTVAEQKCTRNSAKECVIWKALNHFLYEYYNPNFLTKQILAQGRS